MIRLLALIPVALAAPAMAQDAAPVVAAERAFAADGLRLGVPAAFTRWSTEDSIVIGREVTRTRDAYDGSAPLDPAAPTLVWWPNWAGIARSGDLGFTTGGVEVGGVRRGHYFTVWTRQADGSWKWVYDGGSGATSRDAPGADSEPVILPVAAVGSASPEAAMDQVRAAEAALAAAAAADQKAAHLAVLADDGRLYVAPRPPAIGRAAFAEALDGWPPTLTLGPPGGGGSSAAGDMAWTWGPAAWTLGGVDQTGHYVHLWQKRPSGWALAFAQIIGPPPPRPPAG